MLWALAEVVFLYTLLANCFPLPLSGCLTWMWVQYWFMFWIGILGTNISKVSVLDMAPWYKSVLWGKLCVYWGEAESRWYYLQLEVGGLPLLSQTAAWIHLLLNLSVAWLYRHVCACKSQTCVYVYLTLVLWLVISGNPSTSQSKKTIKQRFLKLLPCCKPSTTPSISQSKCSFTLYISAFSYLPL